MGHAHLVFLFPVRLLRPGTRTERHSLALHRTLLYYVLCVGDLLSGRRIQGRFAGRAGDPFTLLGDVFRHKNITRTAAVFTGVHR
jgi:hypothetical protein